MSTYPAFTVDNTLGEAVTVYDAFNDDPADPSLANYFGTLTNLGPVAAGATGSFTPVHGPVSTYIVYDSENNPVKRVFTLGTAPQAFQVTQGDLDVMTATRGFVQLMQDKPDDPVVKQFSALLADGKSSAQAVDAFFKASTDYKSCTYMAYLLTVVTLARTPATRGLPPAEQEYSLSALLRFLGIDWPDGLADITLSHFYCTDDGGRIKLGGRLNVKGVLFSDGVLDHVLAILPSETVRFTVSVDTEPGLAVGSTQLQCVFDTLSVPLGDGTSVSFEKPTVLLSIMPLFKFVVFEIKATIPFALFGGPPFDAVAALTIDNVEAEVGITLDGAGHTLLTPPGLKGLHFDSVGVGMGLMFEPPAFALGVQGTFHIGGGQQVPELDDDTFAVICALEEEVPVPVFLSFYVPRLGLDQVVELFTDQRVSLDFPVEFSDLSFHWAQNPLEPVTLPDGTLAPMGYGFSAAVTLFGLGFYADMELDLNNGLQGQAQLAPFSLGPVLSLTGDGPGVTVKVDANGNPVRNNVIPKTAAAKKAIEQATTRQLVAPGGARLRVSTSSAPYFKLDARLAFLGLHDSVDATIDASGISFALDFGGVISGAMSCVLRDYHNFTATFSYRPGLSVPLPAKGGMSLGSVPLTEPVNATLALTTSRNDVEFTASGAFTYGGQGYQIGPFGLDLHIAALSDVLSAMADWLEANAESVFSPLAGSPGAWAQAIFAGLINPAGPGAAYVVGVLRNGFGQPVDRIGDLLKGSNYSPADVAGAVRSVFGADAGQVAAVLVVAYRGDPGQVAAALRSAGYVPGQIAAALAAACGASPAAVAAALLACGASAQDTARALSDVFGLPPDAISSALQGAGYAVSAVESAFDALGGAFADYAQSAWETVTHYADPTNW